MLQRQDRKDTVGYNSIIYKQLSGHRVMSAFEELGVMPELIKGIEEMDWL